jgi:hypothetical protein
MLVGTKQIMTMLLMDPWITGRRGGRKRKTLMSKGKKRSMKRKILALVIWYLPAIDCLKHLFSSVGDAQLMIWHAEINGRKKDGKL